MAKRPETATLTIEEIMDKLRAIMDYPPGTIAPPEMSLDLFRALYGPAGRKTAEAKAMDYAGRTSTSTYVPPDEDDGC